MKSLVINTDASYNEIVKQGTYAFYITSPDFKPLKKSGVITHQTISSVGAEMLAIFYALKFVLDHKEVTNYDRIILKSDCLPALNKIFTAKGKYKKLAKNISSTLKKVQIKVSSYSSLPIIQMEHVEGHSSNSQKRTAIYWCDKAARKELRKHLKNNNIT